MPLKWEDPYPPHTCNCVARPQSQGEERRKKKEERRKKKEERRKKKEERRKRVSPGMVRGDVSKNTRGHQPPLFTDHAKKTRPVEITPPPRLTRGTDDLNFRRYQLQRLASQNRLHHFVVSQCTCTELLEFRELAGQRSGGLAEVPNVSTLDTATRLKDTRHTTAYETTSIFPSHFNHPPASTQPSGMRMGIILYIQM
jgi:hypothetical protein